MDSPTARDRSTRLLDARELARLESLELRARTIVEGHLSGLHRSPRQGFSVEFAEHREYSAGDDLRHLDWKVYGKRDRLYLKQYEEETNFACHLVVDASESMSYRSADAPLSKWDYAAALSAALTWLILKQQDAVGLTVFDSSVRAAVAPSGQAAHLKEVVRRLEEQQPEGVSQLGAILGDLAEQISRRGLFIVVSDLFDDLDEIAHGLKHLRYRGHDVGVLHVIDPAEQDFPFEQATEFAGLEETGVETLAPRTIRAEYQREFDRFLSQAAARCRDLGVDYRLIRTDEPPARALFQFLTERQRRR